MDSRHPATRRPRRRPGDAGLDPLARCGRSRAQGGRVRHHEASARGVLAAGAHPAVGDAGVVVVVHSRRPVHVLRRPKHAAGDQTALAGLLLRGAAGDGCPAHSSSWGSSAPTTRRAFILPSWAGWDAPSTTWPDHPPRARRTEASTENSRMTQCTTVTASDGVSLALHAYTDIDARRPTILAIHGYPDNHHVWDGVAEKLSRYNFVA